MASATDTDNTITGSLDRTLHGELLSTPELTKSPEKARAGDAQADTNRNKQPVRDSHSRNRAEIDREILNGLRLRKRGNYFGAASAFTAALNIDPQCAAAYAFRGAALRLMGDNGRAVHDCSAAVQIDPTLAEAYYTRGEAYRALGDLAKAVADFSDVVRLDAHNALAYNQRGGVQIDLGNREEAIKDFTSAIALDPRSQWAYQSRGLAHAATGNYAAAVADFTEVLKLDPSCHLALVQRGDARIKLGAYRQAAEDLSAALLIDSKDCECLSLRAQARQAEGLLELSMADWNAAVQLEPSNVENLHGRGLVHRLRGDVELAIADFDAVLRIDPKHQSACNNRGNLHFARGDYDRAIEDYTTALKLDPKFARGYANRGNVYFTRGDCERAVADYTQAVQFDPKFARAFMNRGLAYAKLGRYADVIADCTKAIELQPELAPPYYYRGYAFSKTKNYVASINDLNEALRLDPRDFLSLIERGLVYSQLTDYEAAERDYSAALELEPKNALIYANRAIAYRGLGNHERALADCAKAVALDSKYASAFSVQQARTHLADGDYVRAVAEFTVALALDPENNELKQERANALKFADESETTDFEVSDSSLMTGEEVKEVVEKELTGEEAQSDLDFLSDLMGDTKRASKPAKSVEGKAAPLAREDLLGDDFLSEALSELKPPTVKGRPASAQDKTAQSIEPKSEGDDAKRALAALHRGKKPKSPLGSQIWDAKELQLAMKAMDAVPPAGQPAAKSDKNPTPAKAAPDRKTDIESLMFEEAPVSSMAKTKPVAATLKRPGLKDKSKSKSGSVPILAKATDAKPAESKAEVKTADQELPLPSSSATPTAPSGELSSPSSAAKAPTEGSAAASRATPVTAFGVPMGRNGSRGLMGLAAALTVGCCLYLFTGSSVSGGGNLPVAGDLTAEQLWTQFSANAALANKKFAGRVVKVSGVVEEVVLDKSPRLVLKTPEKTFKVECHFARADKIGSVAVGNKVQILGECELRTDSEGNVQLFCCRFDR